MNELAYGRVEWTVEDVLSIRPEMSPEDAEEFLQSNEKHLRNRIVELGWEVLESLLSYEGK
jgi:hypothetical protein